MNKKGFTLIEIIICLVLVIGIGTASIFVIRAVNNNITRKKLTEIEDKIYEAVNVYIETKTDSKKQLYENNNGVVIPLNVLQNEGLMEFKNIDIKDHYVVSLLGGGTPGDACLGVTEIASWTDKNKTVYLCLDQDIKTYITENIGDILNNYITKNEYILKISSIEDRLNKLEEYHGSDLKKNLLSSDGEYIAKGENPNNWVEFNVTSNSSKAAYFPNDAKKNLWRIMSIDNDGYIKLVYNKKVPSNNSAITVDSLSYKGNNYFYVSTEDYHVSYFTNFSNESWRYDEVSANISDDSVTIITTGHNKKDALYSQITNKNWLVESDYAFKNFLYYSAGYIDKEWTVGEVYNFKKLLIGTISNFDEYQQTLLMGKSYLLDNEDKIPISFIIPRVNDSTALVYLTANGNSVLQLFYKHNYSNGIDYFYYNAPDGDYKPVIVLNRKVKIVKNTTSTCKGTKIQGTEECPYKLECTEC